MNISKAKAHITMLKSTVMTANDLNSAISFFEKFIEKVQEHKNTSIQWSVEDFEQRAKENNDYRLIAKQEIVEYDKSKFEAALYNMICDHDANLGITWDTIDYYLDTYCRKYGGH